MEISAEQLAEALNAFARDQPSMRVLQEVWDALTEESKEMLRALLKDTLP